MTNHLARVAFGMRFEPQWRLLDRIGSVLDDVLRATDTPFDSEFFPLSQTENPHQRQLLDPRTDNKLTFTQQDAILDIALGTGTVDEVRERAQDYQKFVLERLHHRVQIDQVVRYGMLLNLGECTSLFARDPMEVFLVNAPGEPRDMALRFSHRLPTADGTAKKRVTDFRKVIYTLRRQDDAAIGLAVDYQEYFDPPLDRQDCKGKPFVSFVQHGLHYFETTAVQWVQKTFKKKAA